MLRRSTEGRRALFHYRESSCSWNNTDCIRGLDHVTLSYFITASFAPSCLILRLTFSRGLCHGGVPLLPLSVRAQINVLALRPRIPSLLPSRLLPPRFFPRLHLIREERRGGGRGGERWGGMPWEARQSAFQSQWEGTRETSIESGADRCRRGASCAGSSSRLSSAACFPKASSGSSLRWNEGPLRPPPAPQAFQIKEANTPLSCCWQTSLPLPAHANTRLSIPIFHHFLIRHAVFLLLLPAITLRVAIIHSPLLGAPPLPSPLHPPTTRFSWSSIICWRGACCYWSLSGDVGGTSADAIAGSVALFMLGPRKSS